MIGALLLAFSLAMASAGPAPLPDAPEPTAKPKPTVWREITPDSTVHHSGTFSGRRATDPPLRTNRETLRSPGFWLPQIAMGIAGGADVYVNRHNPKASQEIGVDTGIPLVALFGLSYLADRYLWRPIGWGVAAYAITLHTRGAVTGRYP